MQGNIIIKEDQNKGWRIMAANREAGRWATVGFGWVPGDSYRYQHHRQSVRIRFRVETSDGQSRVLHEATAGEARTKAEVMKVARDYVREHGLRNKLRAVVADEAGPLDDWVMEDDQ